MAKGQAETKALQERRKAAGYKSAKAFAAHAGVNGDTYTDYEQGRTALSLERAWFFADLLDCTLDELAGRTPPGKAQPLADAGERYIADVYRGSNEDGREVMLNNARFVESTPGYRRGSGHDEGAEAGKVGA